MKWQLTIKVNEKVIFNNRFQSFEDALDALTDELIAIGLKPETIEELQTCIEIVK